jgi:hypothetical protein
VLNGTKHTPPTALLSSFLNTVDFSTSQPQLSAQFTFKHLTFFTSQSFTLPPTYLYEQDKRAVSGDSRFLPASLPHFIILSPSFLRRIPSFKHSCLFGLSLSIRSLYMKHCVFQNYYGYTPCTESLAPFPGSIS